MTKIAPMLYASSSAIVNQILLVAFNQNVQLFGKIFLILHGARTIHNKHSSLMTILITILISEGHGQACADVENVGGLTVCLRTKNLTKQAGMVSGCAKLEMSFSMMGMHIDLGVVKLGCFSIPAHAPKGLHNLGNFNRLIGPSRDMSPGKSF